MKVAWVRLSDKIRFTQPLVFFSLGQRGSGKSSLLESLAELNMQHGAMVFDMFGSRDAENLAWLRNKNVEGKNILLLRSPNVDVKCCWNTKNVETATLNDFNENDIIISSAPLYNNFDEEAYYIGKLTDLLFHRVHWNRLIFAICREASNLYYSRLKLVGNQLEAKAQLIYMLRESRHSGISLGLDSLRFTSIDVDVRSVVDYLILKSLGVMGLPKDLEWLYYFFNPAVVRSMAQKNFIIVSRTGALGLGEFDFPKWHKLPGEDLLNLLDIKVEYGEPIQRGTDKGTYKTVSDKEHNDIISFYIQQNLGMDKISNRLSRSTKTISDHIHAHNDSISRVGFCPSCRRVKSPLEAQIAKRG